MKLDLIPIKKIKRYLVVTICLAIFSLHEISSISQDKKENELLKLNTQLNNKNSNNLKKLNSDENKQINTTEREKQIVQKENKLETEQRENFNNNNQYDQYQVSLSKEINQLKDNNKLLSNQNDSGLISNDVLNRSQSEYNNINIINSNMNNWQNSRTSNSESNFRFKTNNENNNSNLKNGSWSRNKNNLPFSQYETPVIRRGPKPILAVEAPSPIPLPPVNERFNPYMSIQQSPYMAPGKARASLVPSPLDVLGDMRMRNNLFKVCPCAGTVRCPPCGIIQSAYPQATCSCAPPPVCSKCPPLSLVHEIASRKALQDQRLASELQNLSTSMTKMFKNISKFAGDVLKFETEAKEASLRMEEASLKAQFSRQEMERTSEKARLIAKNTLNRPCLVNCGRVPSDPGEILGMNVGTALGNFIDDSKIFPQEVDSIGEYMKDTYSTNINGYNAREREILSNNRLENESEGNITVEPLGENEVDGTKSMSSNQKNSPK